MRSVTILDEEIPREIEYIKKMKLESTFPLVYEAKLKRKEINDKHVIIKFTRNYSKEVHDLCAHANYAPTMLYYEENSSYNIVVYEYFSGRELDDQSKEAVKAELRKALNYLHDRKKVFGDFRKPNILVNEDGPPRRICLIDFDWSGTEDVDTYPEFVNRELPFHSECEYGNVLKIKHDDHLFNHLYNINE
uniref:Protein kinase domain-containing protein n=1 Tax=Strigamia maritima TaxID=126957 RepID=T1IP58_STRMM